MTVEAPPAFAGHRFESLDALRGICALLVALHHFITPGLISTSALIKNSHVFVDYFFVLSGFVIAFSYGDRIESRRISVGRFMALRFGRIYPLHIAVIAALFLLEVILTLSGSLFASVSSHAPFTGQRSLYSLALNLFLLQAFGLTNELTWNGPSWSIAAEMWSYLLFGLVLLAPKKLVPWLVGALSLGALVLLITRNSSINATYNLGFVRCVYGFGIGFLVYRLFRKAGPKGDTAAEIASVIFAVIFVWLARDRWTLAAPAVFAIGIYILAGSRGAVSRVLTNPSFQLLGVISYSIYMIHVFIMARLVQALRLLAPQFTTWNGSTFVVAGPHFVGDLLTIPYLAVVVGCSYVSYRLIERPGREWTRSWLAHRKMAHQVVTAE